MHLDYQNAFVSDGTMRSDSHAASSQLKKLLPIVQKYSFGCKIQEKNSLPEDLLQIAKFVATTQGKYTDIVLCGIGGSSAGSLMLRDCLYTHRQNQTNIHIADNVDPDLIARITGELDLAKTLFLIVSKSGSTLETIAQERYFRQQIESQGLNPQDHFAFVTGQRGELTAIAKKNHCPLFNIPEQIGGRWSVFTAASLLPAALLGLDIDELLAGARSMAESFLETNVERNFPFQLAALQFYSQKTQQVLMPYSSSCLSMTHWYSQLLAESTGKNNQGLTPISAIGTRDQHSQLQLFLDGPDDKFIIFLEIKKWPHDPIINPEKTSAKSDLLSNIRFSQLLHTELKATSTALREKKRPHITISMPTMNETNLGKLLMLLQGSVVFLGELLRVNVFDQPAVDREKILTHQYLRDLRKK